MERVTYTSFPSRLMVGDTYRTPCRSNASCTQPPVTLSPYTLRTPYRRIISAASCAVTSRLRTPFLGFAVVLALSLFSVPLAAEGQTVKVSRIGYLVLSPLLDPPTAERQAFLDGLRELGYLEGQNIVIEYRSANWNRELLPRPRPGAGRSQDGRDNGRAGNDRRCTARDPDDPHRDRGWRRPRRVRTRHEPRASGREYHGHDVCAGRNGRQALGAAEGGVPSPTHLATDTVRTAHLFNRRARLVTSATSTTGLLSQWTRTCTRYGRQVCPLERSQRLDQASVTRCGRSCAQSF